MNQNLRIQDLLERGLYYYGIGEVKKAIEIWQEVLNQDPGNETACEYIEIETGRKVEPCLEQAQILELEDEVVEEHEPDARPLSPEFIQGQQYLQVGQWDKAAHAFESAHRSDPANPIPWTYVELSRTRLVKEVIDHIGGPEKVPVLKIPLTELIGQRQFTQEEGFVLSLISGDITLEDVTALSPTPRYQTYHLLYRLLAEDLLETRQDQ